MFRKLATLGAGALLLAVASEARTQSNRQFRVYVGVTWGGFFESAEGTNSRSTAHTFIGGLGVGDWSLRLEGGRTGRFREGANVTTHEVASLEAPKRGVATGAAELVNFMGDGIRALPRIALIARVPATK